MNVKNIIVFKKKEMLNFCIQRFYFGFSYSLMIPIIPLYFNFLGLSTTTIGIIMSSYGIAKALVQILFGTITNKLGDKLILILSFVLMSIIPILYTFTSNGFSASVIYIIQGAVLGMSAPATFTLLSRSLDKDKRGECTGYASSVFTLSGAISSIIGGFIVTNFNNYNLVFYMSSIGIIGTIIFIINKIKKDDISNKKNRSTLKIKEIFKIVEKEKLLSKIIVLGSIALLGDFVYGCIVSIFPFYGQEVLKSSAFYTSIIIAIYLFVFGLFAPIGGWTSDKIGSRNQILISFIFMIISLASLSFIRNISFFTVVIIMYFLGATFLNSGLQNSLLKFGENKKIEGVVFGIVGASESCGYAIGPLIASYIYSISKVWIFPGLLLFTLLIFSLFILLKNKAFTS